MFPILSQVVPCYWSAVADAHPAGPGSVLVWSQCLDFLEFQVFIKLMKFVEFNSSSPKIKEQARYYSLVAKQISLAFLQACRFNDKRKTQIPCP